MITAWDIWNEFGEDCICSEARNWLEETGYINDMATAWELCMRPDWMLWACYGLAHKPFKAASQIDAIYDLMASSEVWFQNMPRGDLCTWSRLGHFVDLHCLNNDALNNMLKHMRENYENPFKEEQNVTSTV